MRRQLLAVSFGILVGAVAAHYLDTRPPSTDPTTSSSTASSAPTPGRSNRAAVRNDFRSAFEALLAIVGEDERGIAATLASLPPNVDSPSLKVEVIAAAARTSPSAALHAAVLLDDPVDQARALERIASIWVQLDPPAALAELDVVTDERLRNAFRAAVLREWARQDTLAMVTYLGEHSDLSQQTVFGRTAFDEILDVDAEALLELADGLPASIRDSAKRAALMRLAELDPGRALDYVASMAPGLYRDTLLMSIARGYARNDPDAALAWARSLESSGVADRVLWVVAESDPQRAIDMAFGAGSPDAQLQLIEALVQGGNVNPGSFADRVFALPDSRVRDRAVQTVAANWIARDPDAALEWLLGNAARINAITFGELAQHAAVLDPVTAARATSRIPSDARPAWLEGIAQEYGRADPNGALAWIAQFEGQPGYDGAASELAQALSLHDAPAAARLLASVDDTDRNPFRGATAAVGHYWAQQNPAAAAQWALGLDENRAREGAIGAVARQWGAVNAPAARSWAMSLPQGALRDTALSNVLYGIASETTPDGSLLGAFSSDDAREEAIRSVALHLAGRDRDEARVWIDTQIGDPQERERARRALETGAFKPRP
jgi:hypothetical protein